MLADMKFWAAKVVVEVALWLVMASPILLLVVVAEWRNRRWQRRRDQQLIARHKRNRVEEE